MVKNKDVKKSINNLCKSNGPIVCEIVTDENQSSLFKQGYKQNSKGLFEPQPLYEMIHISTNLLQKQIIKNEKIFFNNQRKRIT